MNARTDAHIRRNTGNGTQYVSVDFARILQCDIAELNERLIDRQQTLMAESMQTQRRVIDWKSQSDEGLRLRCGELTSQEIRTIRAVLGDILPPEPQTELNDRLIDRKPCDWTQDDDGNWDTACKQCLCFDYAPPFEDFGGME